MGIARPVMEKFPYAWAFFIPFILIATFTMLNLFIAVIVGAMQTVSDEEQADALAAKEKTGVEPDVNASLAAEVEALRCELAALRAVLEQTQPRPG